MGTSDNRQLSSLDQSFKKVRENLERKQYTVPTTGFEDNSESARDKRVNKAMKDFLYFDKIYFPPELHTQGWYPPGVLHHTMHQRSLLPGIHWFGTFRNLAKSAYLKKLRIWFFLSGRASIGGILSETLKKSEKFMRGIATIIRENDALRKDFDIKIDTLNSDMLIFTCRTNKRFCNYMSYSLDSNPRGDNVHIDRPDFIDFDDLETNRQVFNDENNHKKLMKIREAYRSCREGATMIGLGNNPHPKCLFNKLKIAREKGEKSDLLEILPFPAWSFSRTETTPYLGSVWEHKYPAISEVDMRMMMKADDDVEWAEAQCDPILKSGKYFPRELAKFYEENELPSDARGLAYCDPNLSEKGKGDTTAFGSLRYSRSLNRFFFADLRCKSYSDSNELLGDYLRVFSHKVPILGMDGNVAQKSTWINNIKNFTRIKGIHFPHITFCHYRVNDLITPFEAIYKQGLVYFPRAFCESEEGIEFMNQLHSFSGKDANKKDDAPDFCISVYTLGIENNKFIASAVGGGTPYFSRSVGHGDGW